ncbi:DUF262 domain-containing protein [Thomasclavelia sp.]|uniref:DUF262 domain-containing protein n=1 Tax=Thomasclavelia sp. TaxID=3025757 RepID=UPI0025DD08AA|nr:DUF262 domain-containing HNH endonuclease family protein [Thomasclavelia sp.]
MSELFKASEGSFFTLSQENRLNIPFFQRRYVWKEENWSELLNSIFSKEQIGFIGSIIVQRKENTVGIHELDVIDGQQRLTTISLLLVAMYDNLDDDKKIAAKDKFRDTLFSKDFYGTNYYPKIKHSKVDAIDYNKIINLDDSIRKSLNESTGIIGCYNYFCEELAKKDKELIKNKFEQLIGGYINYCVIITLEKNADEQAIFDSLNTSGVLLTSSDTIKNNLFKTAALLYRKQYTQMAESKLNNTYENTWEKMFIANDHDKYWDQIIITGRIKRLNLELFLYCFAIIKGLYDANDNTISELSNVYKKTFRNFKSVDEIDYFIDEMMKYAQIYMDNFYFETKGVLYEYKHDSILERLLHVLNTIESTTMYPYVLKLLFEYNNDKDTLNSRLHKLEKYIIINNLTRNTTKVKNYNKLVMILLKDENKIDDELAQIENNSNYILLDKINNKLASMYLFWIELYRRKNEKHDITELKYDYTLEHIMPVKWKENWSLILELKHPDGTSLSEREIIENREQMVHSIGNMTLLKGKLNNKIQNSAFYKKIPSIKKYADLKITKDDIVTPYEQGMKDWSEINIKNRQKKLIEDIKNTFLY